jgi:excisionase family DNA binding protein
MQNGSRFVKGTPMEKISLIAWRRRERKFPETEAQRRARAREQGHDPGQPDHHLAVLEALSTASLCGRPSLDEELFIDTADVSDCFGLDPSQNGNLQAPEPREPGYVDVDLTAEQSQILRSLPLLADTRVQRATPLMFELSKAQAQGRITLQFSLLPKTVPEMISFKELCRQLKVGRRVVMRLVRRGELRCYRIANRYRFAVDDVNNYLDRIAQQ